MFQYKSAKYFSRLAAILACLPLLTGCIRLLAPTSINELQAKSYSGIVSPDVELDYIGSYLNAKRYLEKCYRYDVSFGHSYDYRGIDPKLNRETQTAEIVGYGTHGIYLFRLVFTPASQNKTKINFWVHPWGVFSKFDPKTGNPEYAMTVKTIVTEGDSKGCKLPISQFP